MNFLHILRRFIFIFLAFLCWIFGNPELSAVHYQELGHPHIQACLPGTYTYINHYNSIVQDPDGFICIGARNGILIKNGQTWEHISLSGNINLVKQGNLVRVFTRDRDFILTRSKTGKHVLIDSMPGTGDPIPPLADYPEEDTVSIQVRSILPSRFTEQYEFLCSARLDAGYIMFGTRDRGILIATSEGSAYRWISVQDGLYSNEIIRLLYDRSGNLWALHEHAISRIEFPSAFSLFTQVNGLNGNVKDILRYQGVMYAATNLGLFALQPAGDPAEVNSDNAEFRLIAGTECDFRCLAGTPAGLFAGSSRGLYRLVDGNPVIISPDPVNALFFDSGENVLLAGTERGLHILDLGNMTELTSFSLPRISIDDIGKSPMGFLWLSSRSGALYRSSKPFSDPANLTYTSFTPDEYGTFVDPGISFLSTPGSLYFTGSAGLFYFDPVKARFLPDTLLELPFIPGDYRIKELVAGTGSEIWAGVNHEGISADKIIRLKVSGKDSLQAYPVTYLPLNNRIINCLFADAEPEPEAHSDNVLWIGTERGIIRYDPSFMGTGILPSMTHISGLYTGEIPPDQNEILSSRKFLKPEPGKQQKIPRKHIHIRFEFISTDYTGRPYSLFQYSLTGPGGPWSEWSDKSYAEFTGLKRGRYDFTVRSRDIYGNSSEADSLRFRIKAPVYTSWYAFLFYSLLVLILAYLTRKLIIIQKVRAQYHLEEVIQERTESLIKEKEKAEDLLANILPKSTAEELKDKGKATTSKFKMATVLFADIQGFTRIAEEMNPDTLIDQLDRFYFHFDSVVEKYNIEKIKTIGDAYMAAGGIPIKNRTNPVDVVLAALEMQQHMKNLKESKTDIWDLRIGIHTGSVIAGVVGQKKYSYDIWGDTVNTASRMESSGEIGRVNISATTYKLIKDFFQCEFRGKMPVKYKGDIAMFFVNGLNPTYSEADKITPNSRFFVQIQLLRLLDLEEFIIEKLDKELPEDLFFHNVEHTSHVYAQVELLGRGEKVSDEELLLLRTAALLHDTGYIEGIDDHETRSVEYAREILPVYRYSEDQIERICSLIMSTKLPPEPKDLLEQIINDANLDHIGRVDFLIQSDKLFQEYRMRHKVKSKKEWNQFQINFLSDHEFYTDIAKRMREVPKEQQIDNIRQFS
jgi:class 3 adenylate cyclase/ligand-binding sensor domain-containing protein/HD superfamily phosphodiesterase